MDKPTLYPLPVPWKVAGGGSCLKLVAPEFGTGEPVRVLLGVVFGPLASPPTPLRSAGAAAAPAGEALDDLRYIEIVFRDAVAAMFLPSFSDAEVIPEAEFDWSQIEVDYSLDAGLDAFRRRFWASWRSSGRCPDPGAYILHKSRLLEPPRKHAKKYLHYIICGHDNYVEVIASGYSWSPLLRHAVHENYNDAPRRGAPS